MIDIINTPIVPRGSHPLRDALRRHDERQFRLDVGLSDILSTAVEQWARKNRTRNPELLGAMLTAVVSAVQAMAPEDEWETVGAILAEELRARLSVRQVN